MKKVLFATTAALAISVAGAAQAAEKVQLGLGGYWEEWFGVVDQDFSEGVSAAQQSDREIFVMGSTTTDNGITFGVQIQYEGQGPGGNYMDEAYLTVAGGFGTFIIGNEDNGAYLLHVAAPDVGVGLIEGDIMFGNWVDDRGLIAGSAMGPSPLSATTAIVADADSNKITYVAPNFGGLTLGVSYVPEIGIEVGDLGAGANDEAAFGVAAQYANDFGGAAIKASAGYATLESTDWDQISVGLQVGVAGFTIGGAYKTTAGDDAEAAGSGMDRTVWNVGVSYGQGPWAVSAAYQKSEEDTSTAEARLIQGSFAYTLSPGIAVKGTVGQIDYEDGNTAMGDNDGWAAVTGFALSF